MTWDIWRVEYRTYEEIALYGDYQRERVARGLSFEKAKELVEQLSIGVASHVGYSMHPTPADSQR